jgi:hypothetical protein
MVEPQYPPPAPGVLRIRQSKLETYLRCGLRYQFEEEERTRFATVKMITGSAVDAAARLDNQDKAGGGPGLKLPDIMAAAADGYEEELKVSEIVDSNIEINQGKDHAVNAARVFALKVSPQLSSVVEAQKPIIGSVMGVELAGTPDVITEVGVGDLKVGQPWRQERVDRSRQLTQYGLLHKARFGEYPRRVWIDSISQAKGSWIAERLWSSRGQQDYRAVLDVVDRAVKGMKAGIALPAAEGSWWCSKAWCPFYHRCPAVSRGGSDGK